MRTAFLAVVALRAALSSQTFVVDAANGPGTDFTSLQVAVSTVPDGAVLLVRSGSYSAVDIDGKGVHVFADSGAMVVGGLSVSNIQAGQAVTLRGLSLGAANYPVVYKLDLDRCIGPVTIENVIANSSLGSGLPLAGNFYVGGLRATYCWQLAIRGGHFGPVVLWDSTAAIEGGSLVGSDSLGMLSSGAGLTCFRSEVQVTGSVVRGGGGAFAFYSLNRPNGPGVMLDGGLQSSSLRLLDDVVLAGNGVTAPAVEPLLEYLPGAPVRIDTRTTLSPHSTTYPRMTMPMVTASSAPLGGIATAVVDTEPGDLVILLLGIAGMPTTVAPFGDAFWIDPALYAFAAFGTQQPAAPISGSATVPNDAGLRGLRLVWHGVCFGPVTGEQNTNPGISLIY